MFVLTWRILYEWHVMGHKLSEAEEYDVTVVTVVDPLREQLKADLPRRGQWAQAVCQDGLADVWNN